MYLSPGEMVLPHLFFYFSLLYTISFYLWVSNRRQIEIGGGGHFANEGKGQPIIFPIHYLMSVLLLLKTLVIFFESIRYHYLRVSGQAVLWSAVYYTFAFMKGEILFTVILLIGSRWSLSNLFWVIGKRKWSAPFWSYKSSTTLPLSCWRKRRRESIPLTIGQPFGCDLILMDVQ